MFSIKNFQLVFTVFGYCIDRTNDQVAIKNDGCFLAPFLPSSFVHFGLNYSLT